MADEKKCPYCGLTLRPGEAVCSVCGKALPGASTRDTLRAFLTSLSGRRAVFFAVVVLCCIIGASRCSVSYDGYYRFPQDEGLYYHLGDDWYYAAEGDGVWRAVDAPPAVDYTNYSLGSDWSDEWDVAQFRVPGASTDTKGG